MTQADNFPKAKLRVLLADDNPETRRVVHLMLKSNPDVTVVALAQDGQEAVELALDYRPDLVVMDINMPRKDGLTAFKEMIQTQPDLGGILISSELPSGLTGDDVLPGIQEFLLKPFEFEDLNEAVDRVAVTLRKKRAQQAPTILSRPAAVQQANATIVNPAIAREESLKKLALECARNRRTDDAAVAVFEELARNPACEPRWLQMLAIEYTIRQEWSKLKALSGHMEAQAAAQKK